MSSGFVKLYLWVQKKDWSPEFRSVSLISGCLTSSASNAGFSIANDRPSAKTNPHQILSYNKTNFILQLKLQHQSTFKSLYCIKHTVHTWTLQIIRYIQSIHHSQNRNAIAAVKRITKRETLNNVKIERNAWKKKKTWYLWTKAASELTWWCWRSPVRSQVHIPASSSCIP